MEVYLHAHETVPEARIDIGRYLAFYNTRGPYALRGRIRSSLLQRADTDDGRGIVEAEST